MPYISSSQEWIEQSRLLLEARPSSTRVTTKYTAAPSRKSLEARRKRLEAAKTKRPATDANAPASGAPTVGNLTLKTYDPASGVCLKYRTQRAQEVGRLINALGRLGKTMAGMPEAPPTEDKMQIDTAPLAAGAAVTSVKPDTKAAALKPKNTPAAVEKQNNAQGANQGGAGSGGGGGKKKKKNKK